MHYLALRRRDLRPLQHRLSVLGLSSLGRAESHVLATVDAVLKVLHRSVGRNWLSPAETGVDFIGGQKLLAVHTDARDASRSLTVVDVTDSGCWAELTQTAYIVPGTVLRHEREVTNGSDHETPVADLPPLESAVSLQEGDLLILTRDLRPGRPATLDSGDCVLTPATIGCTIPEVFDDVRSGEVVWFDDGKIGGVVEKVETSQVVVRITHTHLQGGKLRADKGINLPDIPLRLPALTAKDIEDLAFVARHADVVELSFANSAGDVESLQQHLSSTGKRQPAIVLKIETRRGFENLPDMLLALAHALPAETST